VNGGYRRLVSRARILLSPRWLALHAVVLALSVTMVLLGRWQLDVSNSKHFDLQNFGYAFQWWAFTAFGLVMWIRVMRDVGRRDLAVEARDAADRARALPGGVTYMRYLMPQNSAPSPVVIDGQRAALSNLYPAQLDELDRLEQAAPSALDEKER
jgi:hypothetical protein